MSSKGTDRKSFRLEGELWDEFGDAAAGHHKDGRSGILRDFIRWYMGKPGAILPRRPRTAGGQPGKKDDTDGEPDAAS